MEKRERRTRPATIAEEEVLHVTASGVGIDEDKRKVISVRKFVTDPAFVRVSAGVTKTTAPFEYLRIDVAVTVPCYVEEVDKVFARTEEKVAEFLDAAIENYMGSQG